jgi:hypothetical protein
MVVYVKRKIVNLFKFAEIACEGGGGGEMAASFGKIVSLPHVRAGVSVPLGETTGGQRE